MRTSALLGLLVGLVMFVGCGGNTVIPTGAFTDEQKAKIKAEDEAVAAEEGGRVVKKKK
jgi:hypothetical protein